ncbi:hypothetical protein ACHAW5_007865 [Stephanodiscus triporus]|uniref:Disease resistance R13L4/SHOC-2-like LRR domain-containing protein n=1 Tax=Stephanodiscus triporus TaxID=2934178 RepID=A0ABD3PCL4_9STRA
MDNMASNDCNKNDPRYGSLLTGSTWRPSTGPFHTPPAGDGGTSGDRQQQHRQEHRHRREEQLHAGGNVCDDDDPTPNSLTDPITHRVKFSRAEYKAPDSLQNSLDGGAIGVGVGVEGFYGRTPNSMDNSSSYYGGGGGTAGAFRESKSYVERYRDVRDTSYGNAARSSSSARGGRSSADDFGGGRPRGGHVAQRRGQSPAVRDPEPHNRRMNEGGDCESERTPLERWESRRERKMRERGASASSDAATGGPATMSPARERAANVASTRTTIEDRGSRWSPVEAEDEKDGYEEHDDLGAGDRGEIRIGRSREHRGDDKRDGGDRCGGSRSRIDQQRSDHRMHVERSYDDDRRPDPLGHRQSSLSAASDTDNYTIESCDNAQNDDSRLFNVDEDNVDTRNFHVGGRSSLGTDRHIDNRKGSSTMSSSPDRSTISCLKYENFITGGRGGGKSTYADDLKSFTESVTGAVAASQNQGNYEINVTKQQPAGSCNYYGQEYDEIESGGGNSGGIPGIGVPIFHNHNIVAPVSPNDQQHEEGRRVRPMAKDFCKRVVGCEILHSSASGKTDKKYLWISLAVCAASIIALGLTIHQTKKAATTENGGAYIGWKVETTETPSMSSMPSVRPTRAPTVDSTGEPSLRPSTEREHLIGEYVSSLSRGDSNEVGSPQYRAKMWILYEDELSLHLPISSDGNQQVSDSDQSNSDWNSEMAQRIKQRFALATLYYSLGIGDGDLVKGWLVGEECRDVGDYGRAWDGVGCDDDGHVRAVVLDGANLRGTIPSEISLLTSIENLIIKNNPGVIGTIPHTIGSHMTQMRQLGLNGNALTGTIPKTTFRLSNLVYLNLGDNSLTGTIQWEDASHNLKKLERLILHNNHLEGGISFHLLAKNPNLSLLSLSNNLFDGNIDETVGSVRSLEFLYLDGNKLVGSIPDSIGNLINLKSLNLDENGLSGTLPHTIGNLTSLVYLSAKSNAITGGFPVSMTLMTGLKTLNLASNAMSGHLQHLSQMTSLTSIHLYQNSFTGSVEAQLFLSLPNLEVLFLSSNSLTGIIPSEVGGAQKVLKGLYLSENNLMGGIPEEVCQLYKLEDLFVDSNNLEGTMPLCLADLTDLKRLYAFNNKFTGQVPDRLLNLPHLIEVGIEENSLQGGLDKQTCEMVNAKELSIWADCTELDGGCDCCEKCCSDLSSDC